MMFPQERLQVRCRHRQDGVIDGRSFSPKVDQVGQLVLFQLFAGLRVIQWIERHGVTAQLHPHQHENRQAFEQRRAFFVLSLIVSMFVSRMTAAPDEQATVKLGDISFGTNALFNALAAITVVTLVGLYAVLW